MQPENTVNSFTRNDYEIVKRESLYDGFFRMARYHLRYRLYEGGWSNTITRELMERKSAAGVLPYDPVLDKVVLIEQFRPGAIATPDNASGQDHASPQAHANNPANPVNSAHSINSTHPTTAAKPDQPQSPWLYEIVAGVLDSKTEDPGEVAIREAEEESGSQVLDLYPICEYFVSPGGSNEYFWLYCGRVDASFYASSIHGLKDENEDIRSLVLPLDQALLLLKQGKIKTAPAIISLQWLELNREWLKQLWQKK
jgi:ADP-ribose pyrophosphatase